MLSYVVPEANPRAHFGRNVESDNRSNQYGVIFPLEPLQRQFGTLYPPRQRDIPEEQAHRALRRAQNNFFLLPRNTRHGSEFGYEFQIICFDEPDGAQIKIQNAVILVPLSQVDEIRRVGKEGLTVIPFDDDSPDSLCSINAVLGWLTHSKTGRQIFLTATGIDPTQFAINIPIRRSVIQHASDVAATRVAYMQIRLKEGDKWPSDMRKRYTIDTNYLMRFITSITGYFDVSPAQVTNPHLGNAF